MIARSSAWSAPRVLTVSISSSTRIRVERLPVGQHRGGPGVGPDAEQLLGDGVVQLPGQPRAFLDDAELAAALVQPGVGQGDGGVRGEQGQDLQVALGEAALLGGGGGLVSREDDAQHLVAVADRDAEEVRHPRVGGGPALEPGVRADVGEAFRLALGEQHAEHPVLAGQRADGPPFGVADPVHHELGERVALVGHAERRVAGPTRDRADRTMTCSTSRTDICRVTDSTA